MRTRICLAFLFFGLPLKVEAQDLKTAREISAIAKDICYRPRDYGASVTSSGHINGSVETGAILRRFGRAGLSATSRQGSAKYLGLPQDAIAGTAKDYNQCAQNMVIFLTHNFAVTKNTQNAVAKPKPSSGSKPASKPRTRPVPQKDKTVQVLRQESVVEIPIKQVQEQPTLPLPSPQVFNGVSATITHAQKTQLTSLIHGQFQNTDSLHVTVKIITDDGNNIPLALSTRWTGGLGEIFDGWSAVNEKGTNCQFVKMSVLPPIQIVGGIQSTVAPDTFITSVPTFLSLYARCEPLDNSKPVDLRLRFFTATSGLKGAYRWSPIDLVFSNVPVSP